MDEQPTVDFGEESPTTQLTGPFAPTRSPSTSEADQPAAGSGLGLRTKLFLAAATLVLLTLGGALSVATWRTDLIAERRVRESLELVPGVFRAYRADLEERYRAQLRSLVDLPATKALYAPHVDAATRADFAREQAGLLGARTLFMFDRSSRVIGRSDRPDRLGVEFGGVSWVANPLWRHREAAAAIIERGLLSLVASVPVVSGGGAEARVDGALAAAFPMSSGQVAALQTMTRCEVAFLTNIAKRGEPAEVAVTSASLGLGADQLHGALARRPELTAGLLDRGETFGPLDLEVGGETRLVMGVPVKSSSGETLGAFVVTRSRRAETADFRELRNALFATGLALLLASLPLSFVVGRRIARPLEQLASGALAIREGRLDVELPGERGDEVGALARAFSAMLEELREKRALQQLLEELRRRPAAATGPPPTESPSGSGPRAGELFAGRYEVIGMLGRGGMGEVFQARDLELDDMVAIKVLTARGPARRPEAIEMLKREIRLARKISHPNIVRVHDLGEASGVSFVSMEYVPGTTLRAVMRGRGSLALGPAVQVIKQLLRGLDAIHGAGILHRDIKPENVMVLPDGMVKLMDFGIAEATDHLSTQAEQKLVGTPRYMSPEQLSGRKLDGRSDLYAVGVMMYEMFTGEKPISGSSITELLRRQVTFVPPSPREHRADLPAHLVKLTMDCLAKDPDQRPAGASELLAALLAQPLS